jgi:SAM-dependent methyltransferase
MAKIEYINCDNCKSSKYIIFLDDISSWEYEEKFRLVKCSNCGLVYLNPRPKASFISSYYPKESYWGTNLKKRIPDPFWKEKRDKAYEVIYKEIFKRKDKGNILDIGAGTGLFLTKFSPILSWKMYGTELSKEASLYAGKVYGIKLESADFLDIKYPPNYFDVITLNNSLEHLHKPRESLEKAFKCLKSKGLIVITVPNIKSIGFKIFTKDWHQLDLPRHLYHFSPDTLSKILRDIGFNIVGINHGYKEHNYYSLFESFRFKYSPRFKNNSSKGNNKGKSKVNLIVELGKIFTKVFANLLCLIEPIIGSGEVFTIYATKP